MREKEGYMPMMKNNRFVPVFGTATSVSEKIGDHVKTKYTFSPSMYLDGEDTEVKITQHMYLHVLKDTYDEAARNCFVKNAVLYCGRNPYAPIGTRTLKSCLDRYASEKAIDGIISRMDIPEDEARKIVSSIVHDEESFFALAKVTESICNSSYSSAYDDGYKDGVEDIEEKYSYYDLI